MTESTIMPLPTRLYDAVCLSLIGYTDTQAAEKMDVIAYRDLSGPAGGEIASDSF